MQRPLHLSRQPPATVLPMTLAQLLLRVDHRILTGSVDRPVQTLTQDSRKAGPGAVFVALRGLRVDGHDYVPKLAPGTVAAIVSEPCQAPPGTTLIQVADTHLALAEMAAALQGHPSEAVSVIGVTGTNGKTTVTWMLESIAQAAGVRIGVIGTTGNRIAGTPAPAAYTTPLAPEWQALLARMRDAGCRWVAAEVSSIGLAYKRVDATRFAVGVYTNLSQDHLDVHGDMATYAQAKERLFTELLAEEGTAVLCASDPTARAVDSRGRSWRYGIEQGDLSASEVTLSPTGTRAKVQTPAGAFDLELPLVGRFNLENALAATGAAIALGATPEQCARGLAALPRVPGRLEPVPNERGISVLVDYAHTPDALDTTLAALRELGARRVLCVVGCGGDRDRAKRPLMARAAAQGSDLVLATSDNPRSEDPMDILEQMKPGLRDSDLVIVDRAEAIARAVQLAQPGDLVLIAGKGHETTQEIQGVKHPFDDRLIAAKALSMGAGTEGAP